MNISIDFSKINPAVLIRVVKLFTFCPCVGIRPTQIHNFERLERIVQSEVKYKTDLAAVSTKTSRDRPTCRAL